MARRYPSAIQLPPISEKLQQRGGWQNAACACGENRPEALNTKSTPIICDTANEGKRKNNYDNHHVAGRANSPKQFSAVKNTAHVSALTNTMARATLENPEQPVTPGCCVNSRVRRYSDVSDRRIPALDCRDAGNTRRTLRERIGSKWWCGSPVEEYAPKEDAMSISNPDPMPIAVRVFPESVNKENRGHQPAKYGDALRHVCFRHGNENRRHAASHLRELSLPR